MNDQPKGEHVPKVVEPEEVAKPRGKRIPVRVVSEGVTVLVEWLDRTGIERRAVLPPAAVERSGVMEDVLESAAPYGERWESKVGKMPTGKQIAERLHVRGIWTLDDLRANPQGAMQSIYEVCGITVKKLLEE